MRFQSKKSNLIRWVILGTVFLFLGIIAFEWNDLRHIGFWGSLVFYGTLIGTVLFIVFMFYRTYYDVGDGEIRYVSGPFSGSIPINTISKIRTAASAWVWADLKFGLATEGLIITYKKGSTIYFSPEHPDDFIARLVRDNKNIEVVSR